MLAGEFLIPEGTWSVASHCLETKSGTIEDFCVLLAGGFLIPDGTSSVASHCLETKTGITEDLKSLYLLIDSDQLGNSSSSSR